MTNLDIFKFVEIGFITLIYIPIFFSFKNVKNNSNTHETQSSHWGYIILEVSSASSQIIPSEFQQGVFHQWTPARVPGGTEYQESFLYLLFLAPSFCVSQVAYCFSLRHLVISSWLLPWEQKIQIFKRKSQEITFTYFHHFCWKSKVSHPFSYFYNRRCRQLRGASRTVLAHSRYSVCHIIHHRCPVLLTNPAVSLSEKCLGPLYFVFCFLSPTLPWLPLFQLPLLTLYSVCSEDHLDPFLSCFTLTS